MAKAVEIIAAVEAEFPPGTLDLPLTGMTAAQIASLERILRPFSLIGQDTAYAVYRVLDAKGRSGLGYAVKHWEEADAVVNGAGRDPKHALRVNFLASDPCTCVTPFLAAVAVHARGEVDARVLRLAELHRPKG